MIEVVKQGKMYVVVDHILTLNTPFKKKADADFFAQELEAKYQAIKEENENPTLTNPQ